MLKTKLIASHVINSYYYFTVKFQTLVAKPAKKS